MDSRDQRGAVSAVVGILRRLTRIVQIAPFVYLLLYAAYLFLSLVVPDSMLDILDTFIYVSPATSGGLLVLSRLLKLCRWHKTAVLIPLTTQVEGFVDGYLFTLTGCEIALINALTGLLALAYTFLTFQHFLHGFKEKSH